MDVPKLLILFWSFQGGIQSISDTSYCADQLGTLRVDKGGSVTIPCRFSYPKDWDNSTEVRVYWREAQTAHCGNAKIIYDHTRNWTDANYTGRIFMVGDPNGSKTASIRIQGLKETDGPIFCCRVQIRNPNKQGGKVLGWQNQHGTFLMFPDLIQSNVSTAHSTQTAITKITTDQHASKDQGTLQSDFSTAHSTETTITKVQATPASAAAATPASQQPWPSKNQLVIISLAVLIVIILCGIMIFLKMKGIICKPASNMKEASHQTANIQPRVQASTIHRDSANDGDADIRRDPEESEDILYAQIQMNLLIKRSPERGVRAEPETDPQVLYAAVRRADPQDLYATVQQRKRQDQ
ncbi:uncharacterized protein LOC142479729 isoform X2 [Ascaphus truei]|uniref:uncharacterized protein LOC142479729 isoform X2 n=1 Tax=Ascaphus truei TaxID=8439 RepID=UPI003F591306